MQPLLILDGDNLAHRAYHSVPKSVRGTNDRPINALVGWTNMALYVWDHVQPRAVFVGWDTLGVPTYRHELWPAYQGGRQFDPEIVEQLGILPDLARAFGFGVAKQAGCEADDLLAAAALAEAARGGTSIILTNDRDAYQLVSSSIGVLSPRASLKDLVLIGPGEVEERLGVPPELVTDFKALAGDASDSIPGARGVGPKGAAALLRQHGNLDAVLASRPQWAEGEPEGDLVRRFRDVVTLRPDAAHVELPPSEPPRFAEAAAFLRDLGAMTLADRVAGRAGG